MKNVFNKTAIAVIKSTSQYKNNMIDFSIDTNGCKITVWFKNFDCIPFGESSIINSLFPFTTSIQYDNKTNKVVIVVIGSSCFN